MSFDGLTQESTPASGVCSGRFSGCHVSPGHQDWFQLSNVNIAIEYLPFACSFSQMCKSGAKPRQRLCRCDELQPQNVRWHNGQRQRWRALPSSSNGGSKGCLVQTSVAGCFPGIVSPGSRSNIAGSPFNSASHLRPPAAPRNWKPTNNTRHAIRTRLVVLTI